MTTPNTYNEEATLRENTEHRTIGQEFAERWLDRNYNPRNHQGTREAFSRAIVDGVDDFVKNKPPELEPQLRQVAIEAANGDTNCVRETTIGGNTVSVRAKELLRHRRLLFLTRRFFNAIYDVQFPV